MRKLFGKLSSEEAGDGYLFGYMKIQSYNGKYCLFTFFPVSGIGIMLRIGKNFAGGFYFTEDNYLSLLLRIGKKSARFNIFFSNDKRK